MLNYSWSNLKVRALIINALVYKYTYINIILYVGAHDLRRDADNLLIFSRA